MIYVPVAAAKNSKIATVKTVNYLIISIKYETSGILYFGSFFIPYFLIINEIMGENSFSINEKSCILVSVLEV